MAKLVEEIIVVKLSKLVKDSEAGKDILDPSILSVLERAVEEIVSEGIVVEVERA
jgi:hypothetical protein